MVDIFEETMLKMGAFGVLQKIKANSIPDPVNYKPEDKLEPLTMEHFVLAYICLAIGYFLASLVFTYEFVFKKRN